MANAEYLAIGNTAKAKGLKGELKISLEAFFLAFMEKTGTIPDFVFIENRKGKKGDEPSSYLPYFIEHLKLDEPMIVKFEDVNTKEDAEKLQKHGLFYQKEPLEKAGVLDDPEIKEEGWNQLLGYTVFDQNDDEIGILEEVISFSQNELGQVKSNDGISYMLPLHPNLIIEINPEEKEFFLELPDGILDL